MSETLTDLSVAQMQISDLKATINRLRDDLERSNRKSIQACLDTDNLACVLVGSGVHNFDPDPHGLHGLSPEHRRDWILFAERNGMNW